ncbi:cobalamin-binding protein [Rheinheimera texasensis]|uniref:cobalamin-binding protein n=1 Tax=Rheinheimera texasensis TaxID=306205 RepID=UPI00068BEAE6|nr:cobalamin-binding protein [Rheinheimera texasensis]
MRLLTTLLLLSSLSCMAAPPPRLVVLAPHLVEQLYNIDAGKMIVGTVEHADYPVAASKIPRVGNYAGLQLEKILALKPDLVLYWQSGSPAADISRLQSLGIRTVAFEAKTLDDIATDLLHLGELTGQPQQAKQLAAEFRQRLSILRQQYQQQTAVTVFYELWDEPLSTIGPNAWPMQALSLCGGKNIFADASSAYPQVSAEALLQRQPQLILQPTSNTEARRLTDFPQRFASLRAVQLNQLAKPNADLLHRATLRTLDGVAELCQMLAKSRAFYADKAAQH